MQKWERMINKTVVYALLYSTHKQYYFNLLLVCNITAVYIYIVFAGSF